MRQDFVKKNFPDYHKDFDEYSKSTVNKKPMGFSRVQLLRNGNYRVGKLYWDNITVVYGFEKRRPFLRIKTLNGMKLTIFQDFYSVRPKEQTDDNCYLKRIIPHFDAIEFYGDFEWKININELRRDN